MENKKYYTPTIEEFHVGFEYEVLKSGIWNKSIFIKEMSLRYEDALNNCRVKLLDQHDIESLGWGYSGDAKANDNSLEIIYFSIDDYSLSFYLINDMYGDNINISISQTVNGDYDDLFQGNIRNKSELNQVMRMVGIPS